jgi:hypothetical protein
MQKSSPPWRSSADDDREIEKIQKRELQYSARADSFRRLQYERDLLSVLEQRNTLDYKIQCAERAHKIQLMRDEAALNNAKIALQISKTLADDVSTKSDFELLSINNLAMIAAAARTQNELQAGYKLAITDTVNDDSVTDIKYEIIDNGSSER